MRAPTEAMQRALAKLDQREWKCALDLKERVSTLDALVERKLAKRRKQAGSGFFPNLRIQFKRA